MFWHILPLYKTQAKTSGIRVLPSWVGDIILGTEFCPGPAQNNCWFYELYGIPPPEGKKKVWALLFRSLLHIHLIIMMIQGRRNSDPKSGIKLRPLSKFYRKRKRSFLPVEMYPEIPGVFNLNPFQNIFYCICNAHMHVTAHNVAPHSPAALPSPCQSLSLPFSCLLSLTHTHPFLSHLPLLVWERHNKHKRTGTSVLWAQRQDSQTFKGGPI